MANEKQSVFEKPALKTRIKSSNVSLFPEAALGYLLGPLLALISNSVINVWLIQYWDKVLGLGKAAPLFETLLPIVSAIVIIVGNILVGKLMERKPSMAGKARPLVLLGMPLVAIALLVLFIVPISFSSEGAMYGNPGIWSLIVIAIGYNLYYAIAWPMYYTSSSSLVNMSTRDGGKRGLLSTCVMVAQLGAAGLAGMAGGFLVDILNLLPVYEYSIGGKSYTGNEIPEGATLIKVITSPEQANQKWLILMAIMIGALIIGCLLIYYFTRERITEENFKLEQNRGKEEVGAAPKKKVTMKEQAKICVADKFWWLIIIFFFLYQFGGQMKNNDMSFYSQAMTGQNSLSSLINTVGAIPTALGMVIVWPLANKFTKSKTIAMGGVLAFIGALIAFIPLIPGCGTEGAIWGLSVTSFCVKALGTAPAMYIALALMANVIDHQEAVHGVRTDGFTMAVYGSIMVAMSGICNGIIVGLNSAITDAGAKQVLHTILGFGVEGVCYLAMAIMFIWMTVERFTRVDNKAIVADQKAKVLAEGGEWVEPEERARREDEENARIVEEQRVAQLRLDCEKKHLDFETENKKFLAKKEEAEAIKKAKAEEKKKAKEAKEAALSEEQRAAIANKKANKKAKEDAIDAEALKDLNAVRASYGRNPVSI